MEISDTKQKFEEQVLPDKPLKFLLRKVIRIRMDHLAVIIGSSVLLLLVSIGMFLLMERYSLLHLGETPFEKLRSYFGEAQVDDSSDEGDDAEEPEDPIFAEDLWTKDNYELDRVPSILVSVNDDVGRSHYYAADGQFDITEVLEGAETVFSGLPETPLFPLHAFDIENGVVTDYDIVDGTAYSLTYQGLPLSVAENEWFISYPSITDREKFLISIVTTEEYAFEGYEIVKHEEYFYDAVSQTVVRCERSLDYNAHGIGIEWYDSEHNLTINYVASGVTGPELPLTVFDMDTGEETVLLDRASAGIDETTHTNTFGRDPVSNMIYYWSVENPNILNLFNLNQEQIEMNVITLSDKVLQSLSDDLSEEEKLSIRQVSLSLPLNKIIILTENDQASLWVGEIEHNTVASVKKITQEKEADYLGQAQILEDVVFFEYRVSGQYSSSGEAEEYVRYYNLETGQRGQYRFYDAQWITVLSY
jgi:hypothetical protein